MPRAGSKPKVDARPTWLGDKATYDVIVIGAGVVGCLIARALARYRLRILLIDKASDVGEGTTKANTAIVHAGYDAAPGTLKARLNVAGNRLFDRVCSELDVEFDRCGTYVVARSAEDGAILRTLRERGQTNGVGGLTLISGEEMRRREPAITRDTVGALYAATGGIVDPFGLCVGAAENAAMNGVDLRLETEALGFVREHDEIRGVVTSAGIYKSRWTIIAAGLWADALWQKAGLNGFRITPRKGEYFVLDRVATEKVGSVLFPCPTPKSKGILVTRTIHGNLLLGPNSHEVDSKSDIGTSAIGLDEVMVGALQLVPSLDSRLVIRTFAGLRASGNTGDFFIDIPAQVSGLLVVGGIESPGLTASPAIAEYAIEMLREAGLYLTERPDYDPMRKAIPHFARLTRSAQESLISQDRRYGRVVCRCETVTEAEIISACHAIIPAKTYDAVKRRTRLGTGRCQGAFDLPLVIEIMARELGVSPLSLTKQGGASRFLVRETKQETP